MRFVEQPIVSDDDIRDYGPVALGLRGNAYKFASFEEAGRWVDANSQHGDPVDHGAKS